MAKGQLDNKKRKEFLTELFKKQPKEKREKILDIFENKKKLRNQSAVSKFLSLEYPSKKDEKEIQKEANQYFKLDDLIEEFSQRENKLFFHLVSLRVALSIGNKTWASELVESMVHFDFYRYIFDVEYEAFKTADEKRRYKKVLLETLEDIYHNINDKNMGAMLLNSFANYFKNEDLDDLRASLNSVWSLKVMREKIKSKNYGKAYVSFWYSTLHGRTTSSEIFTFLKKALTKKRLKELPLQAFWIFKLYFPSDQEKRDIIFKRLKETLKNGYKKLSPYMQYTLIRLSERKVLKDKLSEMSERFKMALFQLKRVFFRRELEKGNMIHFSIYQLVKMGDFDPHHLWWLAL